jgi:hypothetical protein
MGSSLTQTMSMNLLTLRRSARLLATQGINIGGVNEPLDGSRGLQTSKRKCAVAINRPPLELQSEPEVDDLLKKKRILGKEHVDPDPENTRPSKRKRGLLVEPVYIIPDIVEKKKTTFRGRLG